MDLAGGFGHRAVMRRWFWMIAGLIAALPLYGLWEAMQTPVIVRYRVALAGLDHPIRIVQLSDSHVGGLGMPASRLADIVGQIKGLQPDMVVLTGDYISGYANSSSPQLTRAALAPFFALRAPLGVYAVLGNHDSPAWTQAALAGSPVRFLRDAGVDTGPVYVVGADDITGPRKPVEKMRAQVRLGPTGKPIIILTHEPDFFQWMVPPGDLMIAGHTHGGQIKLPWLGTILNGEYDGSHLRGVFAEHGYKMVVSSGVGSSVLPIRIGVPPEIVELTLVPGHSTGRKSGTDR